MKKKGNKSPFFAKFLEGQQIRNKREIAGGEDPTSPTCDLVISLKYPSDNDEGDVTMKYPSDDDESGGETS